VRILAWQNDPGLDLHFVAAAGAVLQIGVTGSALLVWVGLERLCARLGRILAAAGWRAPGDDGLRWLAALAMALSVATMLGGLVLLG
jgi:putative thiamine transport system permease protein